MTWMDTDEAAVYTRRNVQTIRRAAQSGELHGHQRVEPKGRWMFDSECVDAWIQGSECADRSNVHHLKAKAS